jgi:hypothetical protein
MILTRGTTTRILGANSRGGYKPRLLITYRPIEHIRPSSKNPRRHSDQQVQQIAHSIKVFGFNVPLLVNEDGELIAGHGRWLGAQLLGLKEVPTICLEHLSQVQARAFMIADNRLTENSTWDDQILGQQLKALSQAELDFSLDVIGFEMGQIDVLIEGLAPAINGKDDPADAVPEVSPISVSRKGDLWRLGRHWVYCGNALDSSSYSALMEGQRADMVFTDPPYNVRIAGHAGGLGAIQHKNFQMASGEMTAAEFTDFLVRACSLMADHSSDGSLHFLCMDWRHTGELVTAGKSTYPELKNICVWVKDNGGMGSLYRGQHEFVFVFKSGHGTHHNNVQLGHYGRYRTNVWHYPGVNSFSRSTEEGNLLELHPTVKPVALVADALMDCSNRNDIVLDPFLGSGTTIIAAERTGRKGYGMELDPGYVDTAIRRWQAFTGLSATHAISGRGFADLEQEAGNELER